MTPSAALQDPAFLRFAWIVPGLFIFAGVVLVIIQFGFRKELGSIWLTYRSWWVMGLLGLLVVFGGTMPILASIALLAGFAFRELGRATDLPAHLIWVSSAAIALLALMIPAALCGNEREAALLMLIVAPVAFVFLVRLPKQRVETPLWQGGIVVLGFALLGLFFAQLALLTCLHHPYGFICYVIFATELSDVAAFIFGRLFGRHLIAPTISPRKTWEGAAGAYSVSIILPWLFRFALPGFGAGQLLLAGLIIGIGGQLGDLSISVMKRALGAKDMGTLIPGHGGILDRIDSLIYVAPLFMQLAVHCDTMT